MKIVKSIWKDPQLALEMKKQLDTKISQFEVCLESVPSCIIVYSLIFTKVEENLQEDNKTLFWCTFMLSLFSASFGLAKGLKIGVARIMGSGGHLEGIL